MDTMNKIAFVFAGQGSQSVGMGKDLYDSSPAAKAVFDVAGDAVKTLCFDGPKEQLDITVNTQPCMFTMDLACAAALNECGIHASGVAGFSLGELPALAYAGILEYKQAFDIVSFRARAMHECAMKKDGEMFAVMKLSADAVKAMCDTLDAAYPVNYNCEGQIVVACKASTSSALIKAVTDNGGKCLKLAVSGGFHSPFMDEAAGMMREYVKDMSFNSAKIPVYANSTAGLYGDPKIYLPKQINNPVLWQKTIENMVADGFDTFIEVGAGKTLSGLIKKIDSNVRVCSYSDALHTTAEVSDGK